MYLIGAAHPHKTDSQQLIERCISRNERLVTDAEVLQEILYRYVAIQRRDAIQAAFETLLAIVDEVFPITQRNLQRAKEIVLGSRVLSARDALHLAVMEHNSVENILTFDRGFDGFPGVTRICE
jgi:predicted nucleic acid-binding protein